MCSLPPSKFSQSQDRDKSLFSILQGVDKVIRHLKKLPIAGKGGYRPSSWVGFLPVLSGMTSHAGARLSTHSECFGTFCSCWEPGHLDLDPCSAAA